MTASPISGWWSSTTSATSPSRSRWPCPPSKLHLGEVVRLDDRQDVPDRRAAGSACRRTRRCRSPRPREYCSSPASSASAVTSITWSSETPWAAAAPGRPAPGAAACRSPQMATFATPGTRSSRGRILSSSDHRQLDQRQLVRREPDLHDPAGRRQRLHHDRRRGPGRQRRRHRRPGAPARAGAPRAGRCPRSKISAIDDSCGTDFGAHDVEARDAVQRLLERDGDQLLDLGGGQPEARGLDLDPRRRELGEDVHRHVAKLRGAEDHHRRGDDDDEEPELQARADDPAHRDPSRPSLSRASRWSMLDLELGTEQLGRADRHDLGARRRTLGQQDPVSVDALDLDLVADEAQRLRAGVGPGGAVPS